MTLYDPDDVNQALYKSNMLPPRKFRTVESTAHVRGHKITRYISDPEGISYQEYMRIDTQAVIAFGNQGTRTEGVYADGDIVGTEG